MLFKTRPNWAEFPLTSNLGKQPNLPSQSLPSPGTNTGVGCHGLLSGIFPTQGSNPGLLCCRQILYRLSQQVPLNTVNEIKTTGQNATLFSNSALTPRLWNVSLHGLRTRTHVCIPDLADGKRKLNRMSHPREDQSAPRQENWTRLHSEGWGRGETSHIRRGWQSWRSCENGVPSGTAETCSPS